MFICVFIRIVYTASLCETSLLQGFCFGPGFLWGPDSPCQLFHTTPHHPFIFSRPHTAMSMDISIYIRARFRETFRPSGWAAVNLLYDWKNLSIRIYVCIPIRSGPAVWLTIHLSRFISNPFIQYIPYKSVDGRRRKNRNCAEWIISHVLRISIRNNNNNNNNKNTSLLLYNISRADVRTILLYVSILWFIYSFRFCIMPLFNLPTSFVYHSLVRFSKDFIMLYIQYYFVLIVHAQPRMYSERVWWSKIRTGVDRTLAK